MPDHHHPTEVELRPRVLLVGLSGPSCSGKTTIARLLRDALNGKAFIIHEDDFYKTDAEIPVRKVADGRELQDWDCLESLDLDGLTAMLEFVKREGRVTSGFESKEDQNAVGRVDVDPSVVAKWRSEFESLSGDVTRIAIIDGFLLFSEDMRVVRELCAVRLLFRADYEVVKQRREARKGYVTLEGFWEDPKDYVDMIVWPNYVKDHKFLFENGDVDGEVAEEVRKELGIEVMPKQAIHDLTSCFEWAAGLVAKSLARMSTAQPG